VGFFKIIKAPRGDKRGLSLGKKFARKFLFELIKVFSFLTALQQAFIPKKIYR
jgi:hypothetical protein